MWPSGDLKITKLPGKFFRKPIRFVLQTSIIAALFPLIASAKNFADLVTSLIKYTDAITYVLVSVAVIVFLYGMLRLIASAGNEQKKGEGKKIILYGILGIFIMVSLWGIIHVIDQTFNLDNSKMPLIPQPPK